MKQRLFLLSLLVGALMPIVDLSAYSKRHWEQLMNTGCCQHCDLQKAPLSRIDLTEADMRYSDMRGADLRQATLYRALLPEPEMYHGAKLGGAMWVDGRTCKKGSISTCLSD